MCNAQEIDDLFAALAEADSSCRVSKDVHKFVVRLPQSPHPPVVTRFSYTHGGRGCDKERESC